MGISFEGIVSTSTIVMMAALIFQMFKYNREQRRDQKAFIEQLSASHALPLHQKARGVASVVENEIEEHLLHYQSQLSEIQFALDESGAISAGNLEVPKGTRIYHSFLTELDVLNSDAIGKTVHYYGRHEELPSLLKPLSDRFYEKPEASNLQEIFELLLMYQKTALRAYLELAWEVYKSDISMWVMTTYIDREGHKEEIVRSFWNKLALAKLRYTWLPVEALIKETISEEVLKKFQELDIIDKRKVKFD